MAPLYHLERRVLGVVDDATVGQYHGDTPVADAERHHELSVKFPQSQLSLAKLAMTMPNLISALSQPVRVSEFVHVDLQLHLCGRGAGMLVVLISIGSVGAVCFGGVSLPEAAVLPHFITDLARCLGLLRKAFPNS